MSLTAGDLTTEHLGRKITVTGKDFQVTGMLTRIEHEADYLWERTIVEPEPGTLVVTHRRTLLDFGRSKGVLCAPNDQVTL